MSRDKHEVSQYKYEMSQVKHEVSQYKYEMSQVKHEVSQHKYEMSQVKHEVCKYEYMRCPRTSNECVVLSRDVKVNFGVSQFLPIDSLL